MSKGRLEAFSDGVIAIIITIMVLEMKVPHGGVDLAALRPLVGVFVSYVLSYVFIGIYWVNHHHLMHAVERVNGRILWRNLYLLFWLSQVPFTTGWMGENHFAPLPDRRLRLRDAERRRSPTICWCSRSSPTTAPNRASRPRWDATSRARSPSLSTWSQSRWRSSTAGSPARSTCWWRSSGSFLTAASNGCSAKG